MGGGSYEREVVSAPASAGAAAVSEAAAAAMKRTSADDTCLPPNRVKDGKDAGLKTSAATPIVLAMDVTASRGDDSKIVYDKLPMFFGQMVMCDYCPDPAISFTGIGDAPYEDKAPIQVCDFESGGNLDNWIKKLWLEEGGGGSGEESYELAAYYYGKYAELPAGKKGLFFFTGDEHYYDVLRKQDIQKWIGDDVPADIPASEVFLKLQEKFDVFMLYPQKDQAARQKDIQIELQKRLKREGAKSGEITISLMWDSHDDLDLHVRTPGGREISYQNKKADGGELDVDMNAGGTLSKEPVENVYWGKLIPGVDGPPKGEYKVWIINYGTRQSAPTNWTVSISISGGEPEILTGTSNRDKEHIDVKTLSYSGPVPKAKKEKPDMPAAKGYDNDSILHDWALAIPSYNVLTFKTPKAIVDILLGVISMHSGTRTRSAYIKDLVERGQDEARQTEVDGVLKAWETGKQEAERHIDKQALHTLRKQNSDLQVELDALKESLKLPQRVFVRNFGDAFEDLRAKLAEVGTIVSLDRPTRNDGTAKDYALVEFSSPEEATKAIDTLDGTDFGDEKLSVRRDRGTLPPAFTRARSDGQGGKGKSKGKDKGSGKSKGSGKLAHASTYLQRLRQNYRRNWWENEPSQGKGKWKGKSKWDGYY